MSVPTLYSPEEVAEHLKVTRPTVYGWLSRGKLRGRRVGDLWRITENDLTAFLEARSHGTRRKAAK